MSGWQERKKSFLRKMPIRGQSLANFMLPHDDKAYRIAQRLQTPPGCNCGKYAARPYDIDLPLYDDDVRRHQTDTTTLKYQQASIIPLHGMLQIGFDLLVIRAMGIAAIPRAKMRFKAG
ncbi:MAG: hypothetical protein ABIH24_02500 [Verrucomicrobiota bacterium]